jgi:hypothetical protein
VDAAEMEFVGLSCGAASHQENKQGDACQTLTCPVKVLGVREIHLNGKKAAGRVALVDDEDYDLVMQYKWYVDERFHEGVKGTWHSGPRVIATYKDGKHINLMMHTLLTGWHETDHADGNGLNNQRYNLREVTHLQNTWNRNGHPGSSSKYKGVTLLRYGTGKYKGKYTKWWARIVVNGEQISLGLFKVEEDAARAYNTAALEHFGEYARLNEIREE